MDTDRTPLNMIETIRDRAKKLTLDIPKAISNEERDNIHKASLELLVNVLELETCLLNSAILDKKEKEASRDKTKGTDKTDEEIRNEINKINRKIPRWAKNQNQINSRILKTYLRLVEKNKAPVSEQALRDAYGDDNEFLNNYPQMKGISERNHCKVFDVYDGIVEIWEPANKIIEKYKSNFLV